MNTEQSVELFCRDGSKDAVYRLQLLARGEAGYVVNYQNGRRGGTLASGTKTATPLPYADALKIYQRVLKEKASKGYVGDGQAQAFEGGDLALRVSGVRLQLLNAIEADEAARLIEDPDWFLQQKFDGERRALIITPEAVIGVNRKGLTVALPAAVSQAARDLGFLHETRLDGELVGDRLYVFDALMVDGIDLTDQPLGDRLTILQGLADWFRFDAVRLAPTSTSAAAKRAAFARAQADKGEGVVFKRRAAAYVPGRPATGGDALKYKFVASATVRVSAHTPGKRSVSMAVLDGAAWIDVGHVAIPANAAIPAVDVLIEVRYLYGYPGGALFQPVYAGERNDVDDAACNVQQIKYKAANEDDGATPAVSAAA